MSQNPRSNHGLALLAAGLLMAASTGAWAKSSDRNQPMTIDAASSDGSFADNGSTVLTGDVVIIQGTLEVHAERGEIFRKDGEVARGLFTGKQATMKQVNDDGTPVTATADRIDYDVINEVITLTGNYKVNSPRGSNAGQKMVYNTRTGNMQSGGDGSRVHTVIQPKTKAPASPAKPGAK